MTLRERKTTTHSLERRKRGRPPKTKTTSTAQDGEPTKRQKIIDDYFDPDASQNQLEEEKQCLQTPSVAEIAEQCRDQHVVQSSPTRPTEQLLCDSLIKQAAIVKSEQVK